MHVHAPSPAHESAATGSDRTLSAQRGHGRDRGAETNDSTLLRRSVAGGGAPPDPTPAPTGGPPIQLFSIPGAFDKAIRKIPQVDKGLDKLNSNAGVKKASKVASFLGFKIPFVDRPQPGGGGDGGAGDSECCKSPFPKNRHDASQHDPEADKAGATPAGPDQTAEPSAGPAAEEPEQAAAEPASPPADRISDLAKSKKWSEARKTFESTPASRNRIQSINARTKERFARSPLHVETGEAAEEPAAEPAAAPAVGAVAPKVSVKEKVREARREKVAAALAGERPARKRSPVAAAVGDQLGAAGVGHGSILATAQRDMHGRQAERFQLHRNAAEGRAERQRPQQEAARHEALAAIADA